jgi:hypothetical protein
MKQLNVLVYLPGYGGSFIKFLLSLDKSTYPHVPRTEVLVNDSQRKEFYSFKDLRSKFKWWVKFHQHFYDEIDTINGFVNSDYPMCTIDSHPYEFYRQVSQHLATTNVKQNYLQINIGEEYCQVIDHFNMLNRGFPGFRTGEERKDMQFTKEYNPYIINLDSFFIGEDSFVAEYQKLNQHLQLPDYIDDALTLYRDWRRVRQIDLSLDWCKNKITGQGSVIQ